MLSHFSTFPDLTTSGAAPLPHTCATHGMPHLPVPCDALTGRCGTSRRLSSSERGWSRRPGARRQTGTCSGGTCCCTGPYRAVQRRQRALLALAGKALGQRWRSTPLQRPSQRVQGRLRVVRQGARWRLGQGLVLPVTWRRLGELRTWRRLKAALTFRLLLQQLQAMGMAWQPPAQRTAWDSLAAALGGARQWGQGRVTGSVPSAWRTCRR